MPFTHRLTIRFEDVDYARVVHFPRFFSFCHRAFEAFVPAELGVSFAQMIEERGVGFPVVHAEATFKKPFRLSEECRIEMETLDIGERSFTVRYRLYEGEGSTWRAELRLVNAVIAPADFRSMSLPDDVRGALQRYRAT